MKHKHTDKCKVKRDKTKLYRTLFVYFEFKNHLVKFYHVITGHPVWAAKQIEYDVLLILNLTESADLYTVLEEL